MKNLQNSTRSNTRVVHAPFTFTNPRCETASLSFSSSIADLHSIHHRSSLSSLSLSQIFTPSQIWDLQALIHSKSLFFKFAANLVSLFLNLSLLIYIYICSSMRNTISSSRIVWLDRLKLLYTTYYYRWSSHYHLV